MVSSRAAWVMLFCGFAVLGQFGQTAFAADQRAGYKPGDRVEVGEGSRWVEAVVLSVDMTTGAIQVKLEEVPEELKNFPPDLIGEALKVSLPAANVRRPVKNKAVVKPAAKPATPPASGPKPVVRTWKDRSGKFNVKATYRGLKDGKVTLEMESGKRVDVPFAKLSEDDAKFVAEKQIAEEGNPFEEGLIAGPSKPATPEAKSKSTPHAKSDSGATSASQTKPGAPAKSASVAKPIKVKRHGAKVIQPKTFKQWTFKPIVRQSAVNVQAIGKQVHLSDLPDSDKFWEKYASLHVTDDGSQAVVIRQQGKISDGQFYIQAIDLASQVVGPPLPLPPMTKVFDVSTADNLVACGTDNFGFGSNSTLTIARPQDDQLVVVAQWNPYETEEWEPQRDISAAWLLPGRRVMTLGRHGKAFTIWDIDKLQALWHIPIEDSHFSKMAFSHDLQYLAIAMSDDIALIDLTAGAHVGTLTAVDRVFWQEFAFGDDNQRLCGVSRNGVFQYDLTTGKKNHEFKHLSMRGHSNINYAGDFALLANRYLYDFDREILLWDYAGEELTLATFRNGRMWAVSSSRTSKQPAILMTASMPHKQAIQMAKGLGTREELQIAKPGDAVAIKVDVDPAIASPDDVRSAIAANLTAAGFKVADQAELLVTAVCQRKDPQTIRINTGKNQFNSKPEDVVERSITPHASFISMTLRGEKVWESGYVATPGFTIFLNRDETLDQALARLTSPNVDLIKNAKFTGSMTRPGTATSDGAYGTSPYVTRE